MRRTAGRPGVEARDLFADGPNVRGVELLTSSVGGKVPQAHWDTPHFAPRGEAAVREGGSSVTSVTFPVLSPLYVG